MRKFIIPIIAVLATLASCQKDTNVLKLEMEHFDGAKIHLDDNNYACWDNGDNVDVNGAVYSINVGTDKNTATIADVLQAEKYYAFAPAGMKKSYDNSTYQFTYPAEISRTKKSSKVTFDAPMYAASADDNTLVFKNQGAVLNVVISAASDPVYTGKITSIKVTVIGGILSGTFMASNEGATYVAGANDSTNSVEIKYGEKGNSQSINGETKNFLIPIPATTGTCLRVDVTTTDGLYYFEKEASVNFERSKIYTIPCDLRNTTFIEKPEITYMDISDITYDFTGIQWGVEFSQSRLGSDRVMTFTGAITEIPQNAFKEKNLRSITMPGTISHIGADAFYDCQRLQTITLKSRTVPTLGNETVFYNIGAYNGAGSTKLKVPASSVDAYKAAWGDAGAQYFTDENIVAL